jgi:transposase InsO family protein
MAKTIQEERLRWVLPVVDKEIRLVDAVKVFPHGKRTLERWVAAYKRGGASALEPHSTEPKRYRVETAIATKEQVVALRKKERVCALKLKWMLEEEGATIHERTIGKILKREGLTRRYRVKRITYKYLRAERQPGELMEIDVKFVPGMVAGKQYFQYTAIDTASRWRYLKVYEEQASNHAVSFLAEVEARFPHRIRAVKTDNHSTFTNWTTGANKRSDRTVKTLHALDRYCAERGIIHYLIDPGKPAQNSFVERSHRSDQESFYDRNTFTTLIDLRRKLRAWNTRYNDLMHCGLNGKSPNTFLTEYSKVNPPNVCT